MSIARQSRALWGLWGLSASITGFYLFSLARSMVDARSAPPLRLAPEPRTSTPTGPTPSPCVSMIVPARDEERNILRCIESLLAQDYSDFEVIVVDDGSTDATPALLERMRQTPAGRERLRVVRLDALPKGWAGKPHALHTGAGVARGEWLLFTDADTFHMPSALRSAVTRARHDGADLFTIGTSQEASDFWSRVLLPVAFMGISFMYPPALVNCPRSSVAIANGQFLLIRRAVYERVGGYDTDALRATVVDDLALAQTVKRSGGRLVFVDGRGVVRTHMYRSLAEHWNGWGKNAVAGSRGGALAIAVMAPGLLAITVAPFALLLGGLLRRDWRLALSGAVPTATLLSYRAYLDRMMEIPLRYGWTQPLGGVIFAGIIARSFMRRLRGVTVPWRGRSYNV